jgi:HAD superfamily hydrolase (TIGR01509 family)
MILALDFDGVICDSIDECLLTSYRTYRSLRPSSALPPEVPEPLRREFHNRRGFVRPSGHYYLLWEWITEFPGTRLSSRDFEALEATRRDAVRTFEHAFHAERDAFRETAPADWLALNPLYPGVVDTWPSLLAWQRYIVTTKDRAAVEAILSAHSLVVTGIFARGEMTKPDALRTICTRQSVDPRDVVFVDDSALHLGDARATGVTTCLAKWGYGPRAGYVGSAVDCFADLPKFLTTSRGLHRGA